ncbi:hypothetical protein J6590_087209 [Homalodisca vitripennis]|nr:hypothetical protein J6590_087209 [Homalodisca vitripennis]
MEVLNFSECGMGKNGSLRRHVSIHSCTSPQATVKTLYHNFRESNRFQRSTTDLVLRNVSLNDFCFVTAPHSSKFTGAGILGIPETQRMRVFLLCMPRALLAEVRNLTCQGKKVQGCSCGYAQGTGDWIVCQNKNMFLLRPAIDLNISKSKFKTKISVQKPATVVNHPANTLLLKLLLLLSFRNVVIEGDSHARFLAGMVQHRHSSATKVTAICKPGAKLLNVTSSGPSPPSSCFILLAGTNDIAAGEPHNIYNRLEESLTARLSSADVILGTLPYRHDLPVSHPVNQRTILANYYIEELCVRHSNLKFTRHGMHLRLSGKELLAEIIVEGLVAADGPPDASDACETLASPAQNRIMQHDTYADVIKATSPVKPEEYNIRFPVKKTKSL